MIFMPIQTFPSWADLLVLTLEVLPPVLLGLYLPGPASSVALWLFNFHFAPLLHEGHFWSFYRNIQLLLITWEAKQCFWL